MISLRTRSGLIVAALAATIAFHPVPDAGAAEARRVVVEIHKLKFTPRDLAVSPGDVVVWKNLDIVPHTVTSQEESWDSGTIAAGGEWETVVTENLPGDYYCRFHPSMVASLRPRSE